MINQNYVEMNDVLDKINVINMIEKRRWKWLGHVIRMDRTRNPHKCLSILDYSPGSLLAHLPRNFRDEYNRSLAANNRTDWMRVIFLDRISLNTQCP